MEQVREVPDEASEMAKLRAQVATLRATVAAAHGQIRVLQATIHHQAKTIAEVVDECPPWAPTVATLYWLYGPTRWGTKSWTSEVNRLKPLVRLLGDLPAMKLTPMAWGQYVAQRRLEPHHRGDRPADFLLNLELGRAKQLLTWAVGNKLLKYNPLAAAKKLKAISRRETWLPLDQVEKLLEHCDDVVDRRLCDGDDDGTRAKVLRAMVLCWHDGMMRFGEALRVLEYPDRIGPDGRVELASAETKGRKRRTVFLTPRTVEALRAVPRVEPPKRKTISRWFRDLCERAGVDSLAAPGERQIRPHDLRASGASTADENGAGLTALRDAMGHAQASTTEIYVRTSKAANARRCADVMTIVTRIGPKKASRVRP